MTANVVLPDLQDLFLYSGKHEPKRYFNPQLRKGISSFEDLGNQEEIEMGLESLKKDIESRKIEEVMASYKNDLGDYVFLKAVKV